MSRLVTRVAVGLVATGVLLTGLVWWLNQRGEERLVIASGASTVSSPALIERGAYLARVGNCMGCHTEPGGAAYAGGRGIPTPFGTVYAPNLTPDVASGLGAWREAEFWRAMHNGRGRDGRLLYPAFPYPNYTRVRRDDADAIFAFLKSVPAVAHVNRAHDLSFPFDRQAALAVWRALYFRVDEPASIAMADTGHDAEWARGAYLVEGLGHCNACHASRNALGATSSTLDLAGGLIPVQNWYAPSLTSPLEAGVADWDTQQIVDLLQSGVSARGAVLGPMSEVIAGSTQYLSSDDARAMARYLKALPQTMSSAPNATTAIIPSSAPATAEPDSAGARLYAKRCADCHGDAGEGVAGIYPALAGNRAVSMRTPVNLVHVVLEGGFPPATARNPRPFGMPPFATELSDEEVANLLTYIRSSWGHRSEAVSALDVAKYRSVR